MSADEWNAELDRMKMSKRFSRRSWDELWTEFLASDANRGWWDHVRADGCPVYTIRPEVVRSLAEPGKRTKPAFSAEDAQVEIAFHDTCMGYSRGTVAVAGGIPVRTPLEDKPMSLVRLLRRYRHIVPWADDHLTDLEQRDPDRRARKEAELDGAVSSARADIQDAAGALVCNAEFLKERNELRLLARELDIGIRFPLLRVGTDLNIADTGGRSAADLEAAMGQVKSARATLFRRWWLSQLTTWDLPVPLGPLADMPLGLLMRMFGPDVTIANAIPEHFAVRQDDEHDSLGRIAVADSPLRRPDRASPGSVTRYGRAYQFWRQEMAVRQRFDGKLPYGAADRLVRGLRAAYDDVEKSHVRRIRTLYLHQFE